MLSLGDFVKNALLELSTALSDAKPLVAAKGGELTPTNYFGRTDLAKILTSESGRPISMIEFDIAVTVSEEAGVSSKIGVVAGIFGASVSGDDKNHASGVSRIQFKIPMVLP